MQRARAALSRTFCTAGTSSATKMPMIAMTIKSSNRVNAERREIRDGLSNVVTKPPCYEGRQGVHNVDSLGFFPSHATRKTMTGSPFVSHVNRLECLINTRNPKKAGL